MHLRVQTVWALTYCKVTVSSYAPPEALERKSIHTFMCAPHSESGALPEGAYTGGWGALSATQLLLTLISFPHTSVQILLTTDAAPSAFPDALQSQLQREGLFFCPFSGV